MVRIAILLLLCLLVVNTHGIPAMETKQAGRSPVYHFSVTYGESIVGKMMINTAKNANFYLFHGHGLDPGILYVMRSSECMVDEGVADEEGNLHLWGAWVTGGDLETATFCLMPGSPPPAGSTPLNAAFSLEYKYEVGGYDYWTVDAGSSTSVEWFEIGVSVINQDGTMDPYVSPDPASHPVCSSGSCTWNIWDPDYERYRTSERIELYRGYYPYEITLTVYNNAGNSDSATMRIDSSPS